MKSKLLIPIILGAIGLTVMISAFLLNSSPYVTITEAKSAAGKVVHISADLVPGTFRMDPASGISTFQIRDMSGATSDVYYKGPQPSNMGSVTKLVVIGTMKGDQFVANQIQTKCPSKYDSADSESKSKNGI